MVEKIDISNNMIGSINKLLFKDCTSLTHLSMANNNMLSLTKWAVKNILSLKHLDLSGNRFRDLGGMQYNGQALETINLNNNKVSYIRV
jgi:Leucine-rich repeat (LRR) protein